MDVIKRRTVVRPLSVLLKKNRDRMKVWTGHQTDIKCYYEMLYGMDEKGEVFNGMIKWSLLNLMK